VISTAVLIRTAGIGIKLEGHGIAVGDKCGHGVLL